MTTRHMTWTTEVSCWEGEMQGRHLDSGVSIIFNSLDRVGEGPGLHRHPYSETFIVRRGTVVFFDGTKVFEATAGEIVVVSAGTPHKFTTKSEGVEMLDIHASPEFTTEWFCEATGSWTAAEQPTLWAQSSAPAA